MDKKKEKDRTKQDHNLGDIEEKVREVQDIIERAVDSRNYQKLNQSITQMVNRTVSQYQKEHPAPGGGYKKSEKMRRLPFRRRQSPAGSCMRSWAESG